MYILLNETYKNVHIYNFYTKHTIYLINIMNVMDKLHIKLHKTCTTDGIFSFIMSH